MARRWKAGFDPWRGLGADLRRIVAGAAAGSPPPVVTTYLRDTFTEGADLLLASHVSDSGHTWAGLSGQAGAFTVMNAADDLRVSTSFPRFASNASTPDGWIAEIDHRRITSVVNDQMGLYLNLDPASTSAAITGYRWRFNNATLAWELDKLTASALTQAIFSVADTPDTAFHTYKLTKAGALFTMLRDGAAFGSGSDAGSPFPGNLIGLVGGSAGSISSGSHISRVEVHS